MSQPAGETIEIVGFRTEFSGAFRDLNIEWIDEYFAVEPEDERILGDPGAEIIDKGGEILFAIEGTKPVGTCAIIPCEPGVFKLAKMGVTREFRGRGLGLKLGKAAIAAAASRKARSVILETHSSLKPAIAVYRKLGFVEYKDTGEQQYRRVDMHMRLDL